MRGLGQWLVLVGLIVVVATGSPIALAVQLVGLGLIVSHPPRTATPKDHT